MGNPHGEGPLDVRPHFVIPYWTNTLPSGERPDTGDTRPLPAEVVSYFCPAIHTSAFMPGTDLTVEVDVCNFGDGNTPSLAQVTVWWSIPTGVFIPDADHRIGVSVIPVNPRGGSATTPPMTRMIPADAPSHICLLVSVTHPLDLAGSTPNPVMDRHWAQRNLMVVTAVPGVPILIPVMATNPLDDPAEFVLWANPVPEMYYAGLADEIEGEVVQLDALFTFNEEGQEENEPRPLYPLQMEGREQRPLTLSIMMDQVPETGQYVAFEVTQTLGREQLLGSLAIIVKSE
jgi:hypothetical protein